MKDGGTRRGSILQQDRDQSLDYCGLITTSSNDKSSTSARLLPTRLPPGCGFIEEAAVETSESQVECWRQKQLKSHVKNISADV